MKQQVLAPDTIDNTILQYLHELDAPSTLDPDDPIFAGIDLEQPLGMVEVHGEDTDRFMRHLGGLLTEESEVPQNVP
ncbi:MAG: hypothetical protein WC866_04685 [Patescibacteria group bacterium]|jgi:hypothetical protein